MKILIVDDHALFRDGLRHVLNELDENAFILDAPDYDEALRQTAENPDLDLVLLDLNLPGKNGFAALTAFSTQYPALPVVILSASNQRMDIKRSLDAGALGYIPKETTSAVMLNALRLILSGGIYVPESMATQRSPGTSGADFQQPSLTPRQLQVLSLLIEGHSNKEIGSRMELAEATVKMHVTSILKNLGVNNRTQAAMIAEKLGLLVSMG